MINITYIISNIDKALAFEWIALRLNKEKFNLNFILLNSSDSDIENFLMENKIPCDRITYNGKKDILKAIYITYGLLRKHKTHVLHAHLFDANMVGLTAAWFARVDKRIYTRHHSDFHHVYFPGSVKYDKVCNHLSTRIVAITEIVKEILIRKENVPEKKVVVINHGFDLDYFSNLIPEKVAHVKEKYNPKDRNPVVGIIARQTYWKGIQNIIPAFFKLLDTYPNALLVLANAHGDYSSEISKQLETLPENSFVQIPFETDLSSLYRLFDIYVHVPINRDCEAFGQTYVEALVTKTPSVFTLSGVANEFIVDRQNALVVDYENSSAILVAMQALLSDPELRNKLINKGYEDVKSRFGLNNYINKIEVLYHE